MLVGSKHHVPTIRQKLDTCAGAGKRVAGVTQLGLQVLKCNFVFANYCNGLSFAFTGRQRRCIARISLHYPVFLVIYQWIVAAEPTI